MITKGIVEEIIDQYTVKVRIPRFDGIRGMAGATEGKDLRKCQINIIPRCDISFSPGDIVIIGFEDDDYSKPIILGFLYRDIPTSSSIDLNLNTLTVDTRTILEDNTEILRKVDELQSMIESLENNFQELKADLGY